MLDDLTRLARRVAGVVFKALASHRDSTCFAVPSWTWRQARWLFHRLLRRQPPMLLVLDGPPRLSGLAAITGWVVSRRAPVAVVEAWVSGKLVARCRLSSPRDDVRSRFPHFRFHGHLGFRLAPAVGMLHDGRHDLLVRARDVRGRVTELRTQIVVEDYRQPDDDSLPEHLTGSRREYQYWLRHHEPHARDRLEPTGDDPLISVVVPTYRPDLGLLREAINSVRAQTYPRWELILCDDGSQNPLVPETLRELAHLEGRIRWTAHEANQGISQATNTCIRQSHGDYVAFLDQDDRLAPHAFGEVVKALRRQLTDYLYTDEDRLDEHGWRIDPFFKPDWSPDLVTSYMYAAHLAVYRRAFLDRIGLCRSPYDGAQDWELCLRATGQTTRIQHVAEVLYHWRTGGNSAGSAFNRLCHERGRRAIAEAIVQRGECAVVADGPGPCTFHVRYQHAEQPLVSILIPTRDNARLLRRCLRSIRRRTQYPRYEVIVVDNGSQERATRRLLRRCGHKVMRLDEPFNHSRLNNLAALHARGDLLLLLNDDVEILTDEWLTALVEQAWRPRVGAVGARLHHPDGRVQHAGVVVGLGPVAAPLHAGIIRDGVERGMASLIRNVSAVSGACLMIRKNLYREMGGLDERQFPTSFNDVDLCLRLRQAGYQIIYTPLARLMHHESATRQFNDESRHVAAAWERWRDALMRDPFWNHHLPHGAARRCWAFHWQEDSAAAGDILSTIPHSRPLVETASSHVRARLSA